MKKTIFGVVLIGGIVISGVSAYAQDQSKHDQMMKMPMDEQKPAPATGASRKAVNVGNTICPVSGEKVGQGMEPVTYEYEGKIYNFCCPMCIDEFKKDPQKYIKIVEEELKTETKKNAQEKNMPNHSNEASSAK